MVRAGSRDLMIVSDWCSVGEDIEARVEFLTQDKARLAADVLEYNNR